MARSRYGLCKASPSCTQQLPHAVAAAMGQAGFGTYTDAALQQVQPTAVPPCLLLVSVAAACQSAPLALKYYALHDVRAAVFGR
eukprot:COSAG01_NODE_230_length_21075_cov_13.811603_17_plen_84_part_00